MTTEQIQQMLEQTGLPVTWRAWPVGKAPPLPWICYLNNEITNFYAEGQVYISFEHVRVELYSEQPDALSELKLEQVLARAGHAWTKEREYLTDEQCNMTVYEIEV